MLNRLSAAAFDSRGVVYLKLNKFGMAISDFSSALRLDPKLASAQFGRGFAKRKKGDLAGGNADIAAAMSIDQNIAADFVQYGFRLDER